MKRIVVIGSINVDNVIYTHNPARPGMTVYGDHFLSNIGGKGANQSCAIKFLGGDVTFYGAVGNDDNGKRVQNFLKEAGLAANLKFSDKLSTGAASITIDSNTGENSIIVVPGANYDIHKEDIDKIDFQKYDIILLQLENNIDAVTYVIKKAKQNGLIVILNPAPFHEVPKEIYDDIDLFIPNEHELEQFTPEIKGSIKDRCHYLLNEGVKHIIVTLGSKGSFYIDNEKSFYVASHKVDAVDTTGAGDSFCGALVTALAEGIEIKEAMEFASKVSSITVTRKGAIASLPKRDEIK